MAQREVMLAGVGGGACRKHPASGDDAHRMAKELTLVLSLEN